MIYLNLLDINKTTYQFEFIKNNSTREMILALRLIIGKKNTER